MFKAGADSFLGFGPSNSNAKLCSCSRLRGTLGKKSPMEGNATSSSFAAHTFRNRSNNFLVNSQDTSTFAATILSSILSSVSM